MAIVAAGIDVSKKTLNIPVIPIMRSHRFFLHFRLRFRADFCCVSAEGAGLPFPVTEAFPAVRR